MSRETEVWREPLWVLSRVARLSTLCSSGSRRGDSLVRDEWVGWLRQTLASTMTLFYSHPRRPFVASCLVQASVVRSSFSAHERSSKSPTHPSPLTFYLAPQLRLPASEQSACQRLLSSTPFYPPAPPPLLRRSQVSISTAPIRPRPPSLPSTLSLSGNHGRLCPPAPLL